MSNKKTTSADDLSNVNESMAAQRDATDKDATDKDAIIKDAMDKDAMDKDAMAEDVATANSHGALNEVDRLKAELHESQQRVLRIQADLENFRKRARRDTDESIKYSTMPLLRDLLPVIDNLRRAIESQQSEASATGLLEGVGMVADQLNGVLNEHHCDVIEAEGKMFDPMKHEAVLQQASDTPQGTILRVTQEGFCLHDRVIRPAQVIVSEGPTK